MKPIFKVIIGALVLLYSSVAFSQNDLAVAFVPGGLPSELNICGDADTMRVVVQAIGGNMDDREQIVANVQFASGITITQFLASESTAGTSITNGIGLSQASFSIPDMNPAGLSSVELSFLVRANCVISDSLAQNIDYELVDDWELVYDMGALQGLSIQRSLESYRASLRIPEFIVDPKMVAQKVKPGDCVFRDVEIINSSLGASLDEVIYEIIVPPTMAYQGITLNGLPVTITKSALLSGDTLVSMVVDSSYFLTNTGSGANNDYYFDANELLTAVEEICIVRCPEGFETTHNVSYGCFGDTCSVFSALGELETGLGNINIDFDHMSTDATQQDVGYCRTGVSAVKVTNTGVAIEPGFANMYNVSAGIGIDFPIGISTAGYDIINFSIEGVDLNNGMVLQDLSGNAGFLVDPDGPGGLDDLDGDGYYDDLAPGESFEMVVQYDFDCSAAGFDLANNCDTAFTTRLSGLLEYDDACLNHVVNNYGSYYTIMNQVVTTENYYTPDVVAGTGDVFYVNHQHDRRFFNFDKGCSTGEFYVEMVLPTGIIFDPGNSELTRNEFFNFPIASNVMNGDTLLVKFNSGLSDFMNGFYNLNLAFTADCNASDGQVQLIGDFGFMCDDCGCKHSWYCADLLGTYVHVENPPCPSAPVCDNGIRTSGMDFTRTTFGFTDSTYTTSIDPLVANAKSGLNCDTMLMTLDGFAGVAFSGDSIGIEVQYANPLFQPGTDEIFLYSRGVFEINRGGTITTCDVSLATVNVVATDAYKYLDIQLQTALQSCGMTVQPGDSVSAYLYFLINDEGPYPNTFYLVPDLRGGFYVNNGTQVTCGDYGDQVKIGKNRVLVSGPTNTMQPQGCDTMVMDYKIIPINNGYSLTNPLEYRPAVAIDSVVFTYEPFVLNGFSFINVEASLVDHPVYGKDFFPIGTLDNSGYFVAHFDTLTQFPSTINIIDYAIDIRIIGLPKCEAPTGSFDGDDIYSFHSDIYYKSNYHSFNISGGACVKDTIDPVTTNINYSDPPEIGLENIGDPISLALGDVFVWEIRQCNTTNYADAIVSWLSIEDLSTSISILSIEDVTDTSNIIPLAASTFGMSNEHYLIMTNRLDRAIPANSNDDICNIIRITAQLTDCGAVTANIRSGWNCESFDPTNHPFCAKTTIPVEATSLPPLMSIIQTPPGVASHVFCDTIPVELQLKNTQLGNAHDMRIEFVLPFNSVLVPGSFEVAWPSSGAFVPLGSDPNLLSTNVNGELYELYPFPPYADLVNNGLPGVYPSSITDSSEMLIRYQLMSGCEFVSGAQMRYTIESDEFCGTPADTVGYESYPFYITGAEKIQGHNVHFVTTIPDTTIGGFPVQIDITNAGDSLLNAMDKINVIIPSGVQYVPGSAYSTTGWSMGEPVITTNAGGITTLEWTLPFGMSFGEMHNLFFDLDANGFGCASADFDIGVLTIREVSIFCATTGSDCTVDVETGSTLYYRVHKEAGPTVQIDASVSSTPCEGDTINLLASGTNQITWIELGSGDTLGIGNPLTIVADLMHTGYIASATGVSCSVSSDTVNITTLDQVLVDIFTEYYSILEGDSVQLDASISSNVGFDFQWIPTDYLSDSTILNPYAFPVDTQMYILEAVGVNGCMGRDTVLIDVESDTLDCPILNIVGSSADFVVACGLPMEFPINIPIDSIDQYEVWLDNVNVTSSVQASDSTLQSYWLAGINGVTGPFTINWDVDGNTNTASVPTIAELVNQLNLWNPFGNWYYDIDTEKIWGGVAFHQYGELDISNSVDFDVQVNPVRDIKYGISHILLTEGQHHLMVFDTLNYCSDEILIDVSCENYTGPTRPCITDDIYIMQSMSVCIDTTVLPGNIVSFDNVCGSGGGIVNYELDYDSYCVDYEGVELGSDSACVVICDDFGLCDTTYFCTTVIPYDGFPVANPDSFCVMMNTPGVYDILGNDLAWGGVDTLYFINNPVSGQITLNPDYSITYTPDYDVCERTELLTYLLCNDIGCDEAILEICINCEDIVVFTAVSPNGDGANDVFYIANIENYPNNEVELYNRWGNLVYRETGYLNTWGGEWTDGKLVPDGTYFYILKLNDESKRVFKGYLQIQR